MPEHPTNLTFGSVWEEKDRCVLLTIALGSNYLHSRKNVKNKNTIIVFSSQKIFCDLSLMLETCIKHVNQIFEFSNFHVNNRKKYFSNNTQHSK